LSLALKGVVRFKKELSTEMLNPSLRSTGAVPAESLATAWE
jgi:hypothetical protein